MSGTVINNTLLNTVFNLSVIYIDPLIPLLHFTESRRVKIAIRSLARLPPSKTLVC